MKQRTRIQKPLLGFGWAGYAASVILIAMIVAIAMGVDLRYELLKLVQTTLGDEIMIQFVARLPWVLFAIGDPTISVVTGIVILVICRIAPYRIGMITQLAAFALCVAWAFVAISFHRTNPFYSIGTHIFGSPQTGYNMAGFYFLEGMGTIAAALLLIWISRSWIVFAGISLALATQVVAAFWSTGLVRGMHPDSVILFTFFDIGSYSWFSLAFDICTIGSLLLWAILERRKAFPVHACKQCGYDLAGIPTESPCPECGQKPAAATT